MHFPKSIRWRLQLWYGALLVAILAGFGLTAYHLEKARTLRQIDEGMHERISVLVDALRAVPGPERGSERRPLTEVRLNPTQAAFFDDRSGYYFAVWMQGPAPIAASGNAPAAIPKPSGRDSVTRVRGDFRESFLFAPPVNCVLVGRSITAEQADLRKLAGALAAVGAAVLALGLFGGAWLVSRAIRPVEDISATATRIAAGDLSQRIGTADTDSELGQLVQVLNSTFARLQAAFDQQAQFTADAAHDLRTPVSVILNQAQSTLSRERTAAEYRETVEACQRAAQRMRRLIESLLELARLDAGQEALRRDECDLSSIAEECIALIRPLAEARGIQIHTRLSAARCAGDPERLGQVVTNLLTNAVDYNRPGGEIRVVSGVDEGFAVLTVDDTGAGIAAEDLPRVFDRFRRANLARTGGHAGLGLAIAQAIVHAHGGGIQVVSEPEKGATFTVQIPA